MANCSAVATRICREDTFGALFSGGTPKMLDVRMRSSSLDSQREAVQSQELRSDRQIPDRILTRIGAGGTLDGELSYGGELAAVQTGQISAHAQISKTQTGVFSVDGSGDLARSSGSFVTDGFVVGMQIQVTGFATGANNATGTTYFTLSAVSASAMTTVETLTTESSPVGAVTISSPRQMVGPAGTFDDFENGDVVRTWRSGGSNNGSFFVLSRNNTGTSIAVQREGTSSIVAESAGNPMEVAVDSPFDSLLEAVFQSAAWSAPLTLSAAALASVTTSSRFVITPINNSATSVYSVDGSGDLARASGSFVSDGFKAGMVVKVAGFATAANNGFKTIQSVAAGALTMTETLVTESSPGTAVTIDYDFVSLGITRGMWVRSQGFATAANNNGFEVLAVATSYVSVGALLTNESAPSGSVSLSFGSYIVNGTTQHSFLIEQQQTDLTDVYDQFSGASPNSFDCTIQVGAITSTSFGFLAADLDPTPTATAGDGASRATTTTSILNAVDHIKEVRLNGATFGSFARRVSLRFANNMYPRDAIGHAGAVSVGSGFFDATVELEVYFEDADLSTSHFNWDDVSLSIIFEGPDLEMYAVHFGAGKITRDSRPVTGSNSDRYQSIRFETKREAIVGNTARWTRWPN